MSQDIRCPTHGEVPPALVCTHLLHVHDRAMGFVENSGDPADLQAWCEACEDFYLREGDLTEAFRAFNDFRLVCVNCYATIKARHSRPASGPPPAR